MKKAIFVIIGLFFLAGCTNCPICEVCKEPEEKAMVVTNFETWGENIDNPNELIFRYSVYNYGNVEAKNVVVNCYYEEYNGNIVKEQTKNIGNVASKSYSYQETYMTARSTESQVGFCYTESCDGCLLLQNGIPEFDELIGDR